MGQPSCGLCAKCSSHPSGEGLILPPPAMHCGSLDHKASPIAGGGDTYGKVLWGCTGGASLVTDELMTCLIKGFILFCFIKTCPKLPHGKLVGREPGACCSVVLGEKRGWDVGHCRAVVWVLILWTQGVQGHGETTDPLVMLGASLGGCMVVSGEAGSKWIWGLSNSGGYGDAPRPQGMG